MGTLDIGFVKSLQARLQLRRAVETGTYLGKTARRLAGVFDEVVTIELSAELHRSASEALHDLPQVNPVQGHSVARIAEYSDPAVPTLYFLDGHWSGGVTSGEEDECPVLRELDAIGSSHPDTVIVIDDARLFTSAPPPPHRPEQWPTLIEVTDKLRDGRPDHMVTVLGDQVLAIPGRARDVVDAYGQFLQRPTGLQKLASVLPRR